MSEATLPIDSPSCADALQHYRQRHDAFLAHRLEQEPEFGTLRAAMHYATLLGGKRVRPFLVYATGTMLGSSESALDAPAAAIECIHAYSLVHDDLPAMDNDTLRRGKSTCHIEFDEATAILAGDALQSFAFSLLSDPIPQVRSDNQLRMVAVLAEAAGLRGMCGGQLLDIEATDTTISVADLEHIHRLKTGALLQASVMLGALTAPAVDDEVLHTLQTFAQAIGLAFQVQDDILDVTGDTQKLGKQQGSDQARNKSTYPALLGIQGSQERLQELHQKALHALSQIPYNTALLRAFTDYLTTRDR